MTLVNIWDTEPQSDKRLGQALCELAEWCEKHELDGAIVLCLSDLSDTPVGINLNSISSIEKLKRIGEDLSA